MFMQTSSQPAHCGGSVGRDITSSESLGLTQLHHVSEPLHPLASPFRPVPPMLTLLHLKQPCLDTS